MPNPSESTRLSRLLLDVCGIGCEGFSGRRLRKLPFLTHAFFIQSTCSLEQFIAALNLTIERECKGSSTMQQPS